MKHELMTLPYTLDALEPLMSKETLEFHYGKHHQTYVNNLNNLITGTKFENSTLVEIILESDGGLFNNAAQVYNHDFFWNGLTPTQGAIPAKVEAILTKTFGSVDEFKKEFTTKAIGQFGSGWAWLVEDENQNLKVGSTANQDNPLMPGMSISGTPVLAMDVWEHAYYLKYQNKRADYIEAFFNVIDWNAASDYYEKAMK